MENSFLCCNFAEAKNAMIDGLKVNNRNIGVMFGALVFIAIVFAVLNYLTGGKF